MCSWYSARTYVRYNMVTLATLASLNVARLFMLVVVHWDQEGHSVLTPWQRTDLETSFSELALHLAPAASDHVCPW